MTVDRGAGERPGVIGPDVRFDAHRRVTDGCNPSHVALQAPDTPWGRLRGARGWSIRELADRSGINRGDLSKFERGRGCPTPDQARRLLAAFDGAAA